MPTTEAVLPGLQGHARWAVALHPGLVKGSTSMRSERSQVQTRLLPFTSGGCLCFRGGGGLGGPLVCPPFWKWAKDIIWEGVRFVFILILRREDKAARSAAPGGVLAG